MEEDEVDNCNHGVLGRVPEKACERRQSHTPSTAFTLEIQAILRKRNGKRKKGSNLTIIYIYIYMCNDYNFANIHKIVHAN